MSTSKWYQKKRYIIPLILVVILILVGALVGVANLNLKKENVNTSARIQEQAQVVQSSSIVSSETKKQSETIFKLGDTVTLATIKFKAVEVKELDSLKRYHSKDIMTPSLGAKYVAIRLNITNLTKESISDLPQELNLFDQDDNVFNYNDNESYFGYDKNKILSPYPPLITIDGWIVYEVPKTSTKYHFLQRNSITQVLSRYELN